jgi:peptidoglycan/LPS O-acetylase OafA/YrhL
MSGFLIHSTSLKVDSKIYLAKRFLRIYPLFFISCFIGLVLHKFEGINLFLANLFLLSSFWPNEGPPGNPILITVVVEMVIYIFYLILRKFNTYKVLIVLFIIYFSNIYIINSGLMENIFKEIFFLLFFIGTLALHHMSFSFCQIKKLSQ